MQILAISGSLRAASTNTALLKAAAALASEEVTLNRATSIHGAEMRTFLQHKEPLGYEGH
jgi:NAD(P)H-dependent FMN reductase